MLVDVGSPNLICQKGINYQSQILAAKIFQALSSCPEIRTLHQNHVATLLSRDGSYVRYSILRIRFFGESHTPNRRSLR